VVISKKVDDLLSEYEWTPQEPEGVPTPYLSTLFQWLTTVIDSLALDPKYKDRAYEASTAYINNFYMVSFFNSAFSRAEGRGLRIGRVNLEGERAIG